MGLDTYFVSTELENILNDSTHELSFWAKFSS